MMFSTKAEYGVRVMVELARRGASDDVDAGVGGHPMIPVPLAEIAAGDGLPLAYLEHLVARLRKAGLVDSRRGSRRGEIHALMGPNGSGKSTLANTLLGHPSYEITEGTITFKGEDITEAEPHDRAKAGLFLAFQYPVSIPGVSVANFLRMAINAKREEPIQVKEFRTQLQHAIELLDVDRAFTSRHLNDGFSGGEKKRAEILQMAMLTPDVAILDETDSGLDIDALRTVAEGVKRLHEEQGLGALIITHYQRILHYVVPEFVHILMDGRIVLEGGVELVERLEREGYDQIRQEVGVSHDGAPAGTGEALAAGDGSV